jgi:hypothetical protein
MKRPEFRRPEFKRPVLKAPSLRRSGMKKHSMKGPDLKPPAFVADLYYDLRDRRLLPLVALVLVAILAVPFLLGGDAEEPVSVPIPGTAEGLESGGARASSLTVVEATPGLRDYRKRLKGRAPTDPFAQRFTGPVSGSGSGSSSADASAESSAPSTFSEEAANTESSSTSVEVETGGGSSGGSNDGGSSGGGGAPPHLIVYDYAIDARISYSPPAGQPDPQPQEPFVRQRVLPQTALPGEKAPVVTYLGPGRTAKNKATGKILFAVSGDVTAISGEHRCVSASQSGGPCELLEVAPGFPLTFAYGEGGAHYSVKVLNVELVVVGRT